MTPLMARRDTRGWKVRDRTDGTRLYITPDRRVYRELRDTPTTRPDLVVAFDFTDRRLLLRQLGPRQLRALYPTGLP